MAARLFVARAPQRIFEMAEKKLKPVPKGNKGLSKLPKEVRNKMGFFGKGGAVNAHKEQAMQSPPASRVRGYK